MFIGMLIFYIYIYIGSRYPDDWEICYIQQCAGKVPVNGTGRSQADPAKATCKQTPDWADFANTDCEKIFKTISDVHEPIVSLTAMSNVQQQSHHQSTQSISSWCEPHHQNINLQLSTVNLLADLSSCLLISTKGTNSQPPTTSQRWPISERC